MAGRELLETSSRVSATPHPQSVGSCVELLVKLHRRSIVWLNSCWKPFVTRWNVVLGVRIAWDVDRLCKRSENPADL
jgi:hypothetical protein